MKAAFFLAMAVAAFGLGACASSSQERLGGGSLGAYCSIGDNANTDLCKINGEIGQTRDQAAQAQATADAALRREDGIFCETRTFKRVDSGSCSAGYTLMNCAQTRFTTRAGRSIIRSMNDQTCRFAGKVLEMQVRCCMVGAVRAPSTPASSPATPPAAKKPKERNA